jgi:CRP-like cAMP-binding protein
MEAADNNPPRITQQRLVEGVIAALPLFWGCSPASRAALARHCWALPAERGSVVLEQGKRPPGVFAVAYGAVKAVLRRPDRAERVLRVVGAQQTFGESSALLGRSSPYEAVALEQSKLVVIPTAAILALLDAEPRFARGLVMALAARKAQLYAEMEAATLLNSTQRFASFLRELAGSDRTVSLPFSKTLLASRLGIKKETLSRLLRELVEQRVIEMARRDIAILDPRRLDEMSRAD